MERDKNPSGGTVVKERRAYLDGVRAIACISIFVLHFTQIMGIDDRDQPVSVRRFLEYGFGVSAFILISGALIEGDLIDTPRGPKGYSEYIKRKFFKISPLYYAVLLVLGGSQLLRGAESSLPGMISHLAFAHNLSDFTLYTISPPLWYLAVQMQAYLFLPWIGILMPAKKIGGASRTVYLLLLSVLCAIAFSQIVVLGIGSESFLGLWVRSNPMSVSHSILAHLPNFLVGMSIYKLLFVTVETRWFEKLVNDLLVVSLFSSLVWISMTLDETLVNLPRARYGFPWLVLPLALGLCMIPRSGLVKWFCERPLLQGIGLVSFPFYLVHYPCIRLILIGWEKLGLDAYRLEKSATILAISFLFAISTACLLYYLHSFIKKTMKRTNRH
jgi:peptidoglycan/LPS O-acetylase OafA/YrhL